MRPCDVRRAARRGELTQQTAGLANGYVQGNLVILPADVAEEFSEFCSLNPKPCPVLARTAPGNARVPSLGADIDLRTDLPGYRVWRAGEIVREPTDITDLW